MAKSCHGGRSFTMAAYTKMPPSTSLRIMAIQRRFLFDEAIEQGFQELIVYGVRDRILLHPVLYDDGGRAVDFFPSARVDILLHGSDDAGIFRERLHLLLL